MRKIVVYTLLADALSAACLSVAAGGSEQATGLVFGVLALVAWGTAYALDLAWQFEA